MREKCQHISYQKLCLAFFIACSLVLILFYYDNTAIQLTESTSNEGMTFNVRTETSTKLLNVSDTSNKSSTALSTNNYEVTISNITKRNSTLKPTTSIYRTTAAPNGTSVSPDLKDEEHKTTYLVSNSKCKIPNFDPFNNEAKRFYGKSKYKVCSAKKLLTYVKTTDNIATLYIDKRVVPSYSKKGLTCCHSDVIRQYNLEDPDKNVKFTQCKHFNDTVTIQNPVYVKCKDSKTKKVLYENVHVAVTINDKIQQKMDAFDNSTNSSETYSVLMVGIDSISRLNFIRALPKTYKYVEKNGWIPLKGYNKMGDNTFPNLMAILTGYNVSTSYSVCKPTEVGYLDNCSMVWYDYRSLGYITAYAEDSASIGTFNYRKKGFLHPPVDYYYRPYIIGTENLKKVRKDGIVQCTGPELAGERIFNIAQDFATTFKDYPYFGFFWMNSFSHNSLNSPSAMDAKIKDFLSHLEEKGVTKKSIVIFLSDHGMRFGEIRKTNTGWLEERLPFIYVSFPEYFKENHPHEYQNFKNNTNRLTSPYDLHMTLKHILALSSRKYNITQSDACPSCKSLLEEIDFERGCADAGIEQHWCTCVGFKNAVLNVKLAEVLTDFLLKSLHDVLKSYTEGQKCVKYTIDKVLSTRISTSFFQNETFVVLQIQTRPKAVFESTIKYIGEENPKNLSVSGEISRLDSYKKSSSCVNDANLKKYCTCQSTG